MSSGVSSADPASVVDVVPLVPAWRLSRAFTYAVPPKLAGKVHTGSLVRVPLGGRKVRGVVVEARTETIADLEEVGGIVIPVPLAPPPLTDLLDWIAGRYLSPKGQTYARIVPPRVRAKRVPPVGAPSEPSEPKIVPSYLGGNTLLDAIAKGGSGTWCLRTALGEDRGRLISELVAATVPGGTALVAVPEVRLGSTTLDAITGAFPETCRVDSAVGDAQRSGSWIALAEGASVGAGGRATVLAPAPALRLILVDEENHRTYKEDRSPRFDTRRVAVERARLQGAVCVLLAAAPSVETGAAAHAGGYELVEPERNIDRATRPLIEFVPKPTDRAVSHALHERIRDTLREGGGVALLAPISGYARSLWCADCRRSVRCERCEAGMIYGQSARSVRCPRCKLERAAPDACPTCGASDFRFVGAGSERLSEQLARSFPRAKVVGMDPARAHGLEQGRRIESQIYVTTWIGTKEAIRPEAALVAVLDADALIRRPDFRAAEFAYQALVEMAEWAGPAREGGRLVIQTDEPGHHAIQALARNDYSFFLERELRAREELGYPPFNELIKVQAIGPGRADLVARVADLARDSGARVLGPIEAGVEEKRSELLLKCRSVEPLTPALRDVMMTAPPGTRLRIDVDPR